MVNTLFRFPKGLTRSHRATPSFSAFGVTAALTVVLIAAVWLNSWVLPLTH
jgi:hypothetical protein